MTPRLVSSGCNICSSDVSAENVDDEIKRLRSLPAETLRRDLVSELGSATEALMASAGDRGHCEDDWWAVKIQAREDAGLAGDRTTWVETQADRDFDQLKDVDLKKIDEEQALIRLRIDSLETQIAVAAEHADRQLICFCTSAIKGAFAQHYMCKTCYDAWKRQGSNKKCPFCREAMQDPPVCFHWTPLKPTAALSAPAAQEPLPQTAPPAPPAQKQVDSGDAVQSDPLDKFVSKIVGFIIR